MVLKSFYYRKFDFNILTFSDLNNKKNHDKYLPIFQEALEWQFGVSRFRWKNSASEPHKNNNQWLQITIMTMIDIKKQQQA